MKSQLLQSCRGCVPSNIEAPSRPSPKGRSATTTTSNTARRSSRPLGRAWGGASASSSNSDGVAGGREAPSQPSPKGKERHPNTLKHSGNELPPLGEGWGGASGSVQGLRLPLNHLLPIADIDAGRQRVPVLHHLDALQRVDALLAGGHIGVYGADAVGGGLYD